MRRCVWPLVCASELTSAKNMTAPVVSKLTEGAAMGCRVVEVLAGYLDMMPSMTLFTVLSWRRRSPHRKNRGALTRDGSDKRVDGCTLVPWQRGKSITWDVTIPDTLANSHLPRTSAVSGAAAEEASLRKISKYTGVRQKYDFVAIAVESLGPINENGSIFLREIGKRLTTISGDPRETSFLPSAHFSNPSTLQCRCLSGQFSGGFRTHRLRSQRKCGFIRLYFVDLQGSFVPGAKKYYYYYYALLIDTPLKKRISTTSW